MTTFVLIPGAGGAAWFWHRVVPLLEQAGHEALAVDLPADNPDAGLHAYAALVTSVIGARTNVTLVAQSMGGFTAAVVCATVPVGRLVFVNAMVPLPGETAGAWWDNTGQEQARVAAAKRHGYASAFNLDTYFLHDVPAEVVQQGAPHQRDEAEVAFMDPAAFTAWPNVPIHVIASTEDRFFPVEFQARVARERLGKDVDTLPGGHLVALSQPRALVDRLLAYR